MPPRLAPTTPADERCRLMLDIADRIERDIERFARAESIGSGKPIAAFCASDGPPLVRVAR